MSAGLQLGEGMARFKDKVVFVTGGTSGLGFEACRLFAEEGARLFITDIEERDILQRLHSPEAQYMRCDISKVGDCQKAVQACIDRFDRLDVLFSVSVFLSGQSRRKYFLLASF